MKEKIMYLLQSICFFVFFPITGLTYGIICIYDAIDEIIILKKAKRKEKMRQEIEEILKEKVIFFNSDKTK